MVIEGTTKNEKMEQEKDTIMENKTSNNKSFRITDDGTIVWGHSETTVDVKIRKMKQRLSESNVHSQEFSPNLLLEKARLFIQSTKEEQEEAMTLFYRPDIQQIMSADDCFIAGIYMFEKKKDLSESKRWYERAVNVGGMDAKLRLAWMYRVGEGGLPVDDVAAFEIYAECAAKGNYRAEEQMGDIYMNGGAGIAVNYAAAEEMYLRSRLHGNKFISIKLKDIEKMKYLKQLSNKPFSMEIDNVTISKRGIRVTGKVCEGTIRVGDRATIVGKCKRIQTYVTEWESFDKIYKEPHGDFAFPSDSVRLLLRGLEPKDVCVGDWLKATK